MLIVISGNRVRQQPFSMLSKIFVIAGSTTIHVEGDADAMIIDAAIKSAKSINTVLVGDDTDLLVLLCHHADVNSNDIFFRPEPKVNVTIHRV